MNNILNQKRKELFDIDDQIIQLLKRRFNISKEIGQYKKINNIKPYQQRQKEKHLKMLIRQGNEYGISTEFITDLYELLHKESLEMQQRMTERS